MTKGTIRLGTAEKYGYLVKPHATNWQGEECEILSCKRMVPGYYFETMLLSPTRGHIGCTLSHMSVVWPVPEQKPDLDRLLWAGAAGWLDLSEREKHSLMQD